MSNTFTKLKGKSYRILFKNNIMNEDMISQITKHKCNAKDGISSLFLCEKNINKNWLPKPRNPNGKNDLMEIKLLSKIQLFKLQNQI